MKEMNKADKEKCLALWGCIPVDSDWVANSSLFKTGNDYISAYVSPAERTRRIALQMFLMSKGIKYK